MVNTTLVAVAIVGLWAGAVYEPTAVIKLARSAGYALPAAQRMASYATGLLSIRHHHRLPDPARLSPTGSGRRWTLAAYFAGMAVTISQRGSAGPTTCRRRRPCRCSWPCCSSWGVAGGNFALFSLWLPEQYTTDVRATAFAFCTSIGRFVGAGRQLRARCRRAAHGHPRRTPVALTAIAFALGLLVIPAAVETVGERLPA